MSKPMRVGVKAAYISAGALILTTLLIILFSNSNSGSRNIKMQDTGNQTVDSGSINNYNAARDLTIENNTYNNINKNEDSVKKVDSVLKPISNRKATIYEQTNVTSHNQSGGQTAKEIIINNN